jgi:hypothetical protein
MTLFDLNQPTHPECAAPQLGGLIELLEALHEFRGQRTWDDELGILAHALEIALEDDLPDIAAILKQATKNAQRLTKRAERYWRELDRVASRGRW